ncbi:MAG TPA: hypothetical protein VJ597_02005, partial [Sphingomicrobium sp.]|nr:hypothetical protein [Sphingomicrobium sp.]
MRASAGHESAIVPHQPRECYPAEALYISDVADYRIIPSIEILRQREAVRAMEARHGGEAVVRALRDGAGVLRAQIGTGNGPGDAEGAARVIEALAEAALT